MTNTMKKFATVLLALAATAVVMAQSWFPSRIKLAAGTSFYVAPSGGSDSNSCNSASTPCATFAGAWNQIRDNYDLDGNGIAIVLQAGTHTHGIHASGALVGQTNRTQIQVTGATTNQTLYVVAPTAERAVFLENGAQLVLQNVTLSCDNCANDTITLTDMTNALVLEGTVQFGNVAAGHNEINPGFASFYSECGTIIIAHGQNTTTANFSSASPTLTVASASGIAIGDVATEVTSSSIPVGAAIYSRIPPFLTVSNVVGTTVTLSGNTIAADGGVARNVNFVRPAGTHLQMDPKSQAFVCTGQTFKTIGIAGYTSGFVTLDTGCVYIPGGVNFVNDAGGAAQVNGPPFALLNPGATINSSTDVGSGPNPATGGYPPGTVLSLTSATFTTGLSTVTMNAADWAAINQYFTKYGGTTGYRGLYLYAPNKIASGTVVSQLADLGSSPGPINLNMPATGSGTATLQVGGFVWNDGRMMGTFDPPPKTFWASGQPNFKVHLSSNQSFSASTWTKVSFDVTDFDTSSGWSASNHNYNPQVAGTYLVTACANHTATFTAAQQAYVSVSKNGIQGGAGTPIAANEFAVPAGSDIYGLCVTVLVPMNGTTDTLEVDVFNQGSTPSVQGSNAVLFSYFSGERVSP